MTNSLPQSDDSALETRLKQLLSTIQLPVQIAQRSLGFTQFLGVLNLSCTTWLAFFLWHTFKVPFWVLGGAIVVLGLPGLILGWLYLILLDVCGLTEQVGRLLESSKVTAVQSQTLLANPFKPQVKGNEPKAKDRTGFRWTRLFSLGGQLLEIKSLVDEWMGLTALTGNVMLLANPIFLIVAAIAMLLTLLAALISGVTLMIFLF